MAGFDGLNILITGAATGFGRCYGHWRRASGCTRTCTPVAGRADCHDLDWSRAGN